MRNNLKISLFATFWLIALSISLITPILALSADSFSQEPGDEYIWEVKIANIQFMGENWEVGMQNKVKITAINTTSGFDSIFGEIFDKKPNNETWVKMGNETLLAKYSSSHGIILTIGAIIPFFPHNQTAINETLHYLATAIGFQYYEWIGGTKGYDGEGKMWNGSAQGASENYRLVYKINANGVLQYLKQDNGTASSWDCIFNLELMTSSEIPGLLIGPINLLLCIFIPIYVLISKKKPITSL